MKYSLVCLSLLLLFCCKKKKDEKPSSTTTTTTTGTTTTGGTTTGEQPSLKEYAAIFSVTNTDYQFYNAYASATFYNSKGVDLTSMNYVKINGFQMGIYPIPDEDGDQYRYSLSTETFSAPATWQLSSYYSDFPDTTFNARPFPPIGYVKDKTRTYDKSKDFSITIDVSNCDSMFFTLGGVLKRIAGKSGVTSITFNPADSVKASSSNNKKVEIEVETLNYQIGIVNGRKWKSKTASKSLSDFGYK